MVVVLVTNGDVGDAGEEIAPLVAQYRHSYADAGKNDEELCSE
jgi:hypothetical protein